MTTRFTVGVQRRLTWAGLAVAEVRVHVAALTLPAPMLGGGAGAEACPLAGPAPTGNPTGSPAHP